MRKLFSFLMLLAVAVTVFDSCKKGPEDPFISFRSRKARVAQNWKVVKYLVDNIDSTSHVNTYTSTQGSCGTKTYTDTRTYDIRFKFGKDGRYEKDSTYNYGYAITFQTPGTTCHNIDTLTVDSILIKKGYWFFTGAVGNVKNKERLTLTDGEDQYLGTTYDIIKCSHKEMKLSYAVTVFDTLGNPIKVNKVQYDMKPDKTNL